MTLRCARVRLVAIGVLTLVSAQGCAAGHWRPDLGPSKTSSKQLSMTVEAADPALAAVLLALRMAPSAAGHRAAAAEYRRLGILDTAFDHLTAATRLDPRDAAAYDARARIWRDWGFPQMGMGDAARAVYYAPRSAAAHNTWGTLLAAAGRQAEARRQFELALDLRAADRADTAGWCHGVRISDSPPARGR
jgi:Tfp pilus assembly protein PilF